MSLETYSNSVAQLLTYGDCREIGYNDWPNYPKEVGLTEADIPELIRMATDPLFNELSSDRIEIWAPVHAWRALGQLQAEAAIAPLLVLFQDENSDWMREELPDVYAMIGPAAIPTLVSYLQDPEQGEWPRITASECLREMAKLHPDQRQICVNALTQQLEQFETNGVDLNTILVSDLLDLEAKEAAPMLEKLYKADAEYVDEFMVGTWASVQVALGLKQKSDFSPKALRPKIPEKIAEIAKLLDVVEAKNRKPAGFGSKPSQKSKQAKKSKKKK